MPIAAAPAPIALAVDEHLSGRADAPMEALPLRRVLGGRRSETIAVADVLAAAAAVEAPGAYEISLDDEAVVLVEEPAAAPGPSAPAPVRADEMDFGGLDDVTIPIARSLPEIPLFSSLPVDELHMLIERMTLATHEDGAIVREGDRGGALYVLVDGEARVVAGGHELARIAAGAFFGEVGLLTDEPRSATVEAVGRATTLEISRELFWDIARRSSEVLRTLLRFLRDRLLERLLGSSQLFGGLSGDDARQLASQFVFLELEPGAVAVKQGARSPGLFFLLCGSARAVRNEQPIATLGAGDVFGEISLLLRVPASADVRAERKCWALELPAARFQEIMVTYPQVLAYVSELGDARRTELAELSNASGGRDGRVNLG